MSIFGDAAGAISHAARGTVRSGERLVGAREDGSGAQADRARQQQYEDALAAELKNQTPEQRAQRAHDIAYAAGPTQLEIWQGVKPTGYDLGGDPNAANAYAAQAQQTGANAQQAMNQAAAMSQGVGYELGSQMAQTGQNYGEAIAGQSQAMGRELSQYGQGQGAGIQNLGQQYAGNIQDAGQAAQMFGGRQSALLTGQGMQAGGYGLDQAGKIGQSAGQLNQMGAGVFGQAGAAANRNIVGQQQSALQGLEAQEGPSAAQAQLQSGLNQAQSSNLALARSGRGWGGSASAMASAQGQNAAMGQNAANQSAMLRAQENAAYRSRAAQNIAQAGQLGLGQANVNDAQNRALLAQGMQGVQAGGQMQAQAAGVGQQGYAQQLAAQQAAAAAGQAGIGQNLGAQQAAGQLGVQAQQAGAQLGANAMQAGNQMALGGLESGGNMALGGQQAGAQTQLAGLGQSGQLYGQGAGVALGAQQQALAAQQQQVANNMAYQNQMMGLHQGNQNMQMNQQNINAGAEQASKDRTQQYIGAGIQAAGAAAGAMSDRNEKKDIKPANETMLIPATGPVDTSGNGGPGGYEFGTGISGPNQAQGMASNQAAAGASEQLASGGGVPEAEGGGAAGAIGGALSGAGANLMGGRGNSYSPPPFQPIQFNPTAVPQPMMPQLSDEESKKAIEKAPGYSFEYKDPDAMGATDGMQFGIMAQDLEKTPAGRSVVKKQPDGTRMVDTSRLTMVNTAALNALSREVDELRARAGKVKAA